MIVAGVMSGASADGINVALIDIGGKARRRMRFLGHSEFPYPKDVRRAVLSAMNSPNASVADLARLNFLLAELYADAVLSTQRRFRTRAKLMGCHGQTIYHQGEAQTFLGRKLAVTWQTGDGAVLAARTGCPAVSDFRPADMAAGGKGAPLVPFLDYFLYRDPRVGRIAQNIGGIANLTAIPKGASPSDVFAFDTGPGNMVIDAVTERLFGQPYDRGGKLAARGNVLQPVAGKLLGGAFFQRKPPKTAGREEFGGEFVRRFLQLCGRAEKHDIIATATALTAQSIGNAVHRFALKRGRFAEFVVSGGGTKNKTLMKMLAAELKPLRVRLSDEFGVPSAAKEAVAFALMAYETWNHRPSNVPSATGARRPAILGKISYA